MLVVETTRGTKSLNNAPNHATREHLVPLSHGGSQIANWRNIVLACRRCNSSRGTLGDWLPLHDARWRLGSPMPIQQRQVVQKMRSLFEFVAANRVGDWIVKQPRR